MAAIYNLVTPILTESPDQAAASSASPKSVQVEIIQANFLPSNSAEAPPPLTHRLSLTIPDSAHLKYRLVFEGDDEGIITNIDLTEEQTTVSRRNSSVINLDDFEFARIPFNAKQILITWRDSPVGQAKIEEIQSRFERAGGKGTFRTQYADDQIDGALQVFQEVCACSWVNLKNFEMEKEFADNVRGMTLIQFRQIINDLRFAAVQAVLDIVASHSLVELKKDEKGTYLSIQDQGSIKLTSDYDFQVALGIGQHQKERQVCDCFHEEFQKIWHASSSQVFDCNAYAKRYRCEAQTPQQEIELANLQEEGSLLMMMRVGGNWEEHKRAVLEQLKCVKLEVDFTPRLDANQEKDLKAHLEEEMHKKFAKVEARNEHLQLDLSKEVLNLVASHNPQWPALQAQLEKGLSSPTLKERIKDIASKLTGRHADLAVKASNKLYGQIKSDYEQIEATHQELVNAKQELSKATSPAEFKERFQTALNRHIKYLEGRLHHSHHVLIDGDEKAVLDKIIEDIHASQTLIDCEPDKAHAMFQRCTEFEMKEKKILDERRHLESQAFQIRLKVDSITRLESKIDSLKSDKENLEKKWDLSWHAFIQLENRLERLSVELHKRQAAFKDELEQLEKLEHHIQAKYFALEQLHQEKKMFLKQQGNPHLWAAATALDLQSDLLLLEMQSYNLEGLCFAQEAHVSEGAFAFVVENLQAGKIDVRSLNQYMQALREIGGFFLGHQTHQIGAINKLIEASKYGHRMIIDIKYMQKRVSDLDLHAFPVSQKELTQLGIFFTDISQLRGNESLTQEKQIEEFNKIAQKVGFLEEGAVFDQKELELVNGKMKQLEWALEAWIATVSQHKVNAFFSPTSPMQRTSQKMARHHGSWFV
jgi:hypothetical protein